jgi:hypothetical protein
LLVVGEASSRVAATPVDSKPTGELAAVVPHSANPLAIEHRGPYPGGDSTRRSSWSAVTIVRLRSHPSLHSDSR